jgi:hypothetical protein
MRCAGNEAGAAGLLSKAAGTRRRRSAYFTLRSLTSKTTAWLAMRPAWMVEP